MDNQGQFFIKYTKDIFFKTLQNRYNLPSFSINLRVFIPSNAISLKIYNFKNFIMRRPKTIKFVVRNIQGLSDIGNTDNLSFEVAPKQEGMVGQCYKEKKLFMMIIF